MPPQGNSPSLEDLMKQLATSNLEFQQNMNSSNIQLQQNMSATIQDLKTHLESVGSDNLPSQKIPNPREDASIVTLRSGRELPQITLQQESRPIDTDSEPDVDSHVPQQEKSAPLPFPTQMSATRKLETDEELLKMFQKIPKYVKFLKELCVHKRNKMKGGVELGGIVSALTRNEEFTKYQGLGIFSVPCTIDDRTFADTMLDLGASINVMPISIY
ncbi:hypothetical protein CR513_29355, partial [Mucuna pruriens]